MRDALLLRALRFFWDKFCPLRLDPEVHLPAALRLWLGLYLRRRRAIIVSLVALVEPSDVGPL